MEGPCSPGSNVKFIAASCLQIYHGQVTTCNQSRMSGVVPSPPPPQPATPRCPGAGISDCITHLKPRPCVGPRHACGRIKLVRRSILIWRDFFFRGVFDPQTEGSSLMQQRPCRSEWKCDRSSGARVWHLRNTA